MALIAVAADKGAPGVSTAALTMALTWPGDVLLAECDPAGADLPWRLRTQTGQPLSQVTGVLSLASSLRGSMGHDPTVMSDHVQYLDGGLGVLVGPEGPEQAEAVGGGWAQVAAALAGVPDVDVIADCGRFLSSGSLAAPVLAAADLVVMVTRPSLAGVAHLRHGIGVVARAVNTSGRGVVRGSGLDRIAVVVVDDGAAGRRGGPRQVDQVLADTPGLVDVPVLGVLGWDVRAAAALAGSGWGGGLAKSTLLRTAATTARAVHDRVRTSQRVTDAGSDPLEPAAGPDWTWQGGAGMSRPGDAAPGNPTSGGMR